MHARARRAFGLVEAVIASVIFTGLLFSVFSVWRSSTASALKTVAADELGRAVILCFEGLARDLQSAVVADVSKDLQVATDGRSVTLSVASSKVDGWTVKQTTVKYFTRTNSRNSQYLDLIREESGRQTVCVDGLTTVNFKTLAQNSATLYRASVMVTLGAQVSGATPRAASKTFPVNVSVPPDSYLWMGVAKS
jgi:type II secretory pathway pseudopilin PulG